MIKFAQLNNQPKQFQLYSINGKREKLCILFGSFISDEKVK